MVHQRIIIGIEGPIEISGDRLEIVISTINGAEFHARVGRNFAEVEAMFASLVRINDCERLA